MSDLFVRAEQAAEYVRGQSELRAKLAIVLGSGLGGFAEELQNAVIIPYTEVPGFPRATAEGHAGRLFVGTLGGRKQLTGERITRQDARRMIVRRAKNAGLLTRLGCHSFRATGITVYLLNGGLLEYAQQVRCALFRTANMWVVERAAPCIPWRG